LRIAVVSPFIDRRHGTERALAESLERFAQIPGTEIHLYSQRVEDLEDVVVAVSSVVQKKVIWHRVSASPGPHLLAFLWWLLANAIHRYWDEAVRGIKYDLLFSPGINSLAADAISVHVVFREFYRQVRPQMRFRGTGLSRWPVLIHRHLYYRLLCLLERVVYTRSSTALATVSQHTADSLATFYGRRDVRVIHHGVDRATFSPTKRLERRDFQRDAFQLRPTDFCLLLIGNDWTNKGLPTLLKALCECIELPLALLVVGPDDRTEYVNMAEKSGIASKIRFLAPSNDVMQFYAAADAYVGPSLEDAFGMPVLEAMACGLPAVASARAGVSEIIRDGHNGFILPDPEDAIALAALLRRLCLDTELRCRLGKAAVETAEAHSWERNANEMWDFLLMARERRA